MGTALTYTPNQPAMPGNSLGLPVGAPASQANSSPTAPQFPTPAASPFDISGVVPQKEAPPDILADQAILNAAAEQLRVRPTPTIPADIAESSAPVQQMVAIASQPVAAPASPTIPGDSPIEPIAPASPTENIEKVPLPSIDEMEEELNKSGLLLPELHVGSSLTDEPADSSPLARLQPGYIAPKNEFFTPVVQRNSLNRTSVQTSVGQNSMVVQATPQLYTEVPDTTNFLQAIPFEWIFVLILAAQLAIAIAQVAYFSLHQYPTIEAMVIAGNMPAISVQNAAAKAFAIAASAGVGFFFGVAGIIYRNDRQKTMLALGCLVMIVANIYIQNFLAVPELTAGHPLLLYQAWMSK